MLFTYTSLTSCIMYNVWLFGLFYKHLVQSTVLYPNLYPALTDFTTTTEAKQIKTT